MASSLHTPPAFTFADLFAGIGGMRRGLETVGGQCLFTAEWDRFARLTYEANFDCADHDAYWGDIRRLGADAIPSVDVLAAGFPCQPFSLAGVSKKNSLGRRHGFDDETQGTLFFDVQRLIDAVRPRAFVLENVKNLLSHDRGRTIAVIMGRLRGMGYRVPDPAVLDASCVVPQKRSRVFIVGIRSDVAGTFSFDEVRAALPEDHPTLASVLHPEDGSELAEEPYTTGVGAGVSEKYGLSEHLWRYLQEYAMRHRAAGNGFGFGLVGPSDVARTLSARYHKDGAEILVRRPCRPTPRRLTPREAARLMGFDHSDGSPWSIPVSDTQAYRQFGNAVVPPLVAAIGAALVPVIAPQDGGAALSPPLAAPA